LCHHPVLTRDDDTPLSAPRRAPSRGLDIARGRHPAAVQRRRSRGSREAAPLQRAVVCIAFPGLISCAPRVGSISDMPLWLSCRFFLSLIHSSRRVAVVRIARRRGFFAWRRLDMTLAQLLRPGTPDRSVDAHVLAEALDRLQCKRVNRPDECGSDLAQSIRHRRSGPARELYALAASLDRDQRKRLNRADERGTTDTKRDSCPELVLLSATLSP